MGTGETLQIIYFSHIHPANQSGLLLRALATASQPGVIPGMGIKAKVSPGVRLGQVHQIRLLGDLKSEIFPNSDRYPRLILKRELSPRRWASLSEGALLLAEKN